MKWFLVLWLLTAGAGVSVHIIKERRERLLFLSRMQQSLCQLAYYMYQWRMPVEEVVGKLCREEQSYELKEFYGEIQKRVLERKKESLGQIWQMESRKLFERNGLLRQAGMKQAEMLWCDSFLYIPMEPEALRENLLYRAEQLGRMQGRMEEKYKGEQKLVMALGIFSGAFLCLMLW